MNAIHNIIIHGQFGAFGQVFGRRRNQRVHITQIGVECDCPVVAVHLVNRHAGHRLAEELGSKTGDRAARQRNLCGGERSVLDGADRLVEGQGAGGVSRADLLMRVNCVGETFLVENGVLHVNGVHIAIQVVHIINTACYSDTLVLAAQVC